MTKIPPSKGLQPTKGFLGEPFLIEELILPRPACAYGVQWLGTDQLLDKYQQTFISVRQIGRAAFFDRYESAAQSASDWLASSPDQNPSHAGSPPLAIVPLSWDERFERVVLIQGVINP